MHNTPNHRMAVFHCSFSAEPGRKAPYSADIRWRQRAGMQLPFSSIACNLNIAVGTAFNIYHRFEETGDVSPTKANYVERRSLDGTTELLIIGILWNCTNYLTEICQKVLRIVGVSVSPSTICRIIHRN